MMKMRAMTALSLAATATAFLATTTTPRANRGLASATMSPPVAESAVDAAAVSVISGVVAREILDSRGNPTVEVEVTTAQGTFRADVPSGASTGAYEACELRDGDKSRYGGKGVLKAVANVVETLGPEVVGMSATDQKAIDEKMIAKDGTPNKTNLGANAILGVSLAVARAGAAAKGVPLYQHIAELAGNAEKFVLPVPAFNVINGGSHAGNKLAFQEYFVIPDGAASFAEAMRIGCEVYHTLKKIIKAEFGGDATLIGDEGGFAPPCDARSGLDLCVRAIEEAGYAGKCSVGLDVAASEFKVPGEDCYDLGLFYSDEDRAKETEKLKLTAAELSDYYANLCADFPVITIEDAFDQDDWQAWASLIERVGDKVQIVGDDLTVTNPERIQRAIADDACNALLLKVNQIGTLTESIDAVKLAKSDGWGIMTSHRSGETEDTFIADVAVGLCTGQIKSGAPCRGERTSKYNQLLRIEEQLASTSGIPVYAGPAFRTPNWMG
mmetsp:Transcript_12165/g.36663  ORF Transcript_12165/g.36663 Transcript_12165/m.36663 type:complete len:498 (-) Transcript_12165:287-1780(-)